MKLASLIVVLFLSVFSKAQNTNFNKTLQLLLKDVALNNASIGFCAVDVKADTLIALFNAEKSLIPASTMKLVTTAAALELLGAKKQFFTTIKYSGTISSEGVLNGNIFIIGGGDPCLGATRFKHHYGNFMGSWVTAIQQLGIKSIKGQVIADGTIFSTQLIPDTWIWGDLGNYFGAGPCGLSIYENQCKISFQSGVAGTPTTLIKVSPFIPDLSFENLVISKNTHKDEAYVYGAPYQNNRMIKGFIPANKSSFTIKGSIPDPVYLAAYELDGALKKAGCSVSKAPTTVSRLGVIKSEDRVEIMRTSSPYLSSIINKTNKYSINLYAEHLVHQIALKNANVSTTAIGVQDITAFWKSKKMDENGFFMVDGSGLSRFNALTAKQLVQVLVYMDGSANKASFVRSLSVSGQSGTLRSIGKGTAAVGKIKAKSGYMTRVRSYAGYATTANNRTIAFALIVNNYNCTAYQMKKKMEQIMIGLTEIKD